MNLRIEDRDPNLKPHTLDIEKQIAWYDAGGDAFTVRGLPWYEENKHAFRRLPDRAEALVREPVWALAQHSAGARLSFRTDSTAMHVKVKLIHANTMSHMPLTGSSGLALYEGEPRFEKPWPVAFPGSGEVAYERTLFTDQPATMRTFTLYLPLYNGIEKLEIGLSPQARLEAPPPTALPKPVLFYGTSITQGGCAHNPGADYPSIVGRRLNLDTINLGFSGNGRGEPEMARLLAEVDTSLYVLDYVANSGVDGLAETLPGFIDILRQAHPTTPIAIVSRIIYSSLHYNATASGHNRVAHERQRDICMREYLRRRDAGDAAIHFLDGNCLIPYGADLAYSDAGVHPSNVGFAAMAEALIPQLEYILQGL